MATTASVAAFPVGMFTYDALSFIQVTFFLFIVLGIGMATLLSRPSEWTALAARRLIERGRFRSRQPATLIRSRCGGSTVRCARSTNVASQTSSIRIESRSG